MTGSNEFGKPVYPLSEDSQESMAVELISEISSGVVRALCRKTDKIERNVQLLAYKIIEPKLKQFVETWGKDFRALKGSWKTDFKELRRTWGELFGELKTEVAEAKDAIQNELKRYETDLSSHVDKELEKLRGEYKSAVSGLKTELERLEKAKANAEAVSSLQAKVEELEQGSVSNTSFEEKMRKERELAHSETQQLRGEITGYLTDFSTEQVETVKELVEKLVEEELLKYGLVSGSTVIQAPKPKDESFFSPTGMGSVVPSEAGANAEGITVEPADYLLEEPEEPENLE